MAFARDPAQLAFIFTVRRRRASRHSPVVLRLLLHERKILFIACLRACAIDCGERGLLFAFGYGPCLVALPYIRSTGRGIEIEDGGLTSVDFRIAHWREKNRRGRRRIRQIVQI